MKILRLNQLPDARSGHFLKDLIPGQHINSGGLAFAPPGQRAHTHDGPDGRDYHVHDDAEFFVVLGGKARMEINGSIHHLTVGDICIVAPGEDHHMISDESDPSVHLWLHAGPQRHKGQQV